MKAKIILATICIFTGNALAVAPNEVLEVWRQNYSLIDEIPLEVSYNEQIIIASSTVDPNLVKKPLLITNHRVQQDGKYRQSLVITDKNHLGEIVHDKMDISFNGIEERYFYPFRQEGTIFAGKSTSNLEYNILKDYLLITYPPRLKQILTKTQNDPNYVLLAYGQQTKNNIACEVFKLFRKGSDYPRSELWVAADKGMLPIFYQMYDEKGKAILMMEVLEVAKSGNFWYPQKARKGLINNPAKHIVWEITVDKLILNPVIDPNIFKLEFPVGTTVFDRKIKEVYKVGVD